MATTWIGDCGEGTLDLIHWSGTTGTATVDTTTPCPSGDYQASMKLDGATGAQRYKNNILADAGRRISFYLNAHNYPSSNSTIAAICNGSIVACFSIGITTLGKLYYAGGASTVTGSTILAKDTWYRICVSYTITNTTTHRVKVWIDGAASPEIDSTAGTLANVSSAALKFSFSSTADYILIRNVYVDNVADYSDTGDRRTTAKLLVAANVTNWNSLLGNQVTALANVSERPTSDTNGVFETTTTQKEETFTFEAASAGFVDLTGATIIGSLAWVRSKITATTGSPAPQLTFNGADNAITLTTSPAMYYKLTDSATYPVNYNGQGIGMKSSGAAGDTYLYECGVVFVYIPYVAQNYTETNLAWTMTNTPNSFTFWSDLALASSITLTPDSITQWSDLALACGVSATPDETDSRSDSDLALAIAATLVPEGTDVGTFYDLVRAIGASIDVALTDIAAFKDLSTTYGIILSPESADQGAFNDATAYAISIVPISADSNGYAENVMVVITALPNSSDGQGYYDLGQFPLGILMDKSESRTMGELIRQVASLLNVAETDIFHQAIVPGPPVQGFFIVQRPKAPSHYKELALM